MPPEQPFAQPIAQPDDAAKTPPSGTSLEAQGVGVRLGGTGILHDINFSLPQGIVAGLLGPNGSGKSTLLRAIAGLTPYSGRLTVLGRESRSWAPRERARRLAVVRQTQSLVFDQTVEELVLLGRGPHKGWLDRYDSRDHALVRAALEQVEMAAFAHRSTLTLSGGELQRVFFAQVLVQDPELLLLDEPTAHLDVHHQYDLMHRTRALVGTGRTALVVFHDMELAARYADHLIVLRGGRIVAEGSPASVLSSDLIREVFRMKADVEQAQNGYLRITYRETARETNTNAEFK